MMEKEKKKFTFFDLFLGAFFLVCITAALLRRQSLQTVNRTGGEGSPHLLELQCELADPRVANSITAGETVYLDNGRRFGVVREVRVEPYVESVVADGAVFSVAWDPEVRARAVLVVECVCRRGESAWLSSDGVPICVGEVRTVRTAYACLGGALRAVIALPS